jgi:hypothetical protein
MLGSSDIHSPTGMYYDLSMGDQRTMTLVFATERTEEAVREALFSGRTAVYTGELLIGKKEILSQLFEHSIEVVYDGAPVTAEGTYYIQIANRSEVPFKLVSTEPSRGIEYPEEITLYPERTVLMQVKVSRHALNDLAGLRLSYVVKNLYINRDTGLPVEIRL